MKSRQRVYEYEEGPDAARRMNEGMERVLRVSKDELAKRESEYQKTRLKKRRKLASR